MKTKENSNLRKNLNAFAEQIKDKYINQGYTKEQLAIDYGCSTSTIGRFLKEHNINKVKRKFTDDVKNELKTIIESRMKNESLTSIFKDLKINHSMYKEIMGISNSLSKNVFDESIVDLNNPIFCYLLGMFISDGHMDSDRIYICQCNAPYLHKIQKLINHKGNLNKVADADNPCYKLTLLSSKLRNFLQDYNIQSNKKLNAPFINCGNNSHHFIRGLFDGDGCLYYSYVSGKFKEKNLSFSTGSLNVVLGIENFLKSHNIDFQTRSQIKKNINYTVNIEKFKDMLELCKIMYKDSGEAFLDRKYYNYIKFKNLVEMNQKVNEIVDASMKVEE